VSPWRTIRFALSAFRGAGRSATGPVSASSESASFEYAVRVLASERWLEDEGIDEPINLCYFGTSDPRFYQIQHVRVPCDYLFSPPFGLDDSYRPTIVPGYLAISATHLQGERDTDRLREIRRAALERAELIDRVGNSIFIYRLEQ